MADPSGLLVIERILRDRHGIWQQVVQDRDLTKLTGRMLGSSMIALALYGAVLGSFHSVLMALTSAVKLPLLFLVTLAICLPTLYLFNLVFGARLSVRQSLSLVMVALTVTAMLALAFAPISLFFLITAPDYGFFKLLNVAILALSALVGLRFLTGGMRVLNDHGLLQPETPNPATPTSAAIPTSAATPAPAVAPTPAVAPASAAAPASVPAGAPASPALVGAADWNDTTPALVGALAGNGATAPAAPAPAPVPQAAPAPIAVPPGYTLQPIRQPARPPVSAGNPPSMTLLYVWIFLFGFVGTQLAWTLRPFFGSPDMDYALYRQIDGNFYAEIFRTIAGLF